MLRDVSAAGRGSRVFPNGAGKTTCFYIITGLIAADTGTVTLDGEDTNCRCIGGRTGIGYPPQEASIFRGLTVEQNIRRLSSGGTEPTSARP